MFFQIFFIVISATSVLGNFYDILGVSRSATDFDIKRSYKKLARQWHPDKNRSPEANERITKINEAYEALSNPEKRKEYDAFGSISNEPRDNRRQGNFGNAYFDFGQNDESENHFESTNYRNFKIDILPNSYKQPTLILLVSHFCFSCHHAMRLWGSIANQITESGIRVTLSDVMADAHLREELRIHHVPTVVMIIDGQVKYLQSEISKETVIDFIRYSFPRDLVQTIESEAELNHFHDSWLRDSRSKMIMTKPLDRPSFRYLSVAFKYRDKISAGFINLGDNDNRLRKIVHSYGLRSTEETVIVFHDEKRYYPNNIYLPKPVEKKSQSRLTFSDIDTIVQSNYMLPFPRLLSQSVFDLACPPPSQKQRSFGFCAIAVVHSKHKNNLSQSESWQYVRSSIGDRGNGKMLYMFGDVQYKFLQSLQLVDPNKNSMDTFMDQVILLWRHSYTSATSLFLSNPWQYSNIEMVLQNWDSLSNFDKAVSILKTKNQIQNKIIDSDTLLELVDELAAPLWMKIISRLWCYCQQIYSYSYDTFTEPFNLIILVLGLVLASYVYSTVKAVSAHITEESSTTPTANQSQYSKMASPSMVMADLTNDLYRSMLTNAQPGQLICVMLTTTDTSHKLLLAMQHSIAKLKCKSLVSLTLSLDLHPHWLQSLLTNIVNEDDHRGGLASIAAVNRPFANEGIVLALNLSRSYLSICPFNLLLSHHHHHDHNHHRSRDGTVVTAPGNRIRATYDSSSFDLDTDSDTDAYSSDASDAGNGGGGGGGSITDVHGRFFDWLCQLIDGTCRRYHVGQWPPVL